MCNFRDLHLDRDLLDECVKRFLDENDPFQVEFSDLQGKKKRYKVIGHGMQPATVEIYDKNDGTTTIHYKLGKNQELGEKFAKYLKDCSEIEGPKNIEQTMDGFVEDDVEGLIHQLHDEDQIKDIKLHHQDDARKVWKVTSIHDDEITISYYPGTYRLQMQGKALTAYKTLVYLMVELLPMATLDKVVTKQESNRSEVINTGVAQNLLQQQFPKVWEALGEKSKKMLVSSLAIRLAAPKLHDYTMCVFPELRVLEGVLKEKLLSFELEVDYKNGGFGEFFDKRSNIKRQFHRFFEGFDEVMDALQGCHQIFRAYRNQYFHADQVIEASMIVDTVEKADHLATDVLNAIEKLYSVNKNES